MSYKTPKQHAKIGVFHLEEAVLGILLEAKHEGQCIGPANISRLAGIFREPGDPSRGERKSPSNMIVTSLLVKMKREGRVE